MNKIEFLPDIQDYLEQANNSKAVTAAGQDELIFKVCAFTGLDYDSAKIIVKLFFHEMRNAVLRGDNVVLSDFGRMFLSSPKSTHNKKRVFLKFSPHKKFLRKINE